MEKGLKFSVFLVLSVIAIAGFILAEGNNSGSNESQNNGTDNNQTSNITCSSDGDCQTGYECEDGFCALDDDENETEIEDECEWQCSKWSECLNKTQTRTCTNVNNCSEEKPKESKKCEAKSENKNKVCCKSTETNEDNETKIEYEIEDRESCLEEDEDETKEIVNESFCREKKFEVREKQRIKFEGRTGQQCPEECTCAGVAMKCMLSSGREMTIFAGNSGNVIIQIKGVNASTNVTLYKENETIVGNFTGGRIREIKILPDEIKVKLREKIKSKIEESETEIELEDDGNYKVKAKKESRLFWMIKVREKIEAQIDSETGETEINSPWWGFMSNDIEED